MFDLQAFAREVHKNAVEHGWWEGERKSSTIRALIVSEFSEALEEARAGRPMVWHKCNDPAEGLEICELNAECPCKVDMFDCDCHAYDAKPEGIAVELIDGCIRILDCLEYEGLVLERLSAWMERAKLITNVELEKNIQDLDLDDLIDFGEYLVNRSRDLKQYYLSAAFGLVWEWLQKQSLSPEWIIRNKHRYNRTRPYKHGKVF